MSQSITKRLSRFGSAIIMLVLLGGILGFYYFKYVPDRRKVFNRNAFLELNQIETALLSKNRAWHDAIKLIFNSGKPNPTQLSKFNYFSTKNIFKFDDTVAASLFARDEANGHWQLYFPIKRKSEITFPFSKNADTLLFDLISAYRDNFDNYLLIRDAKPNDTLSLEDSPDDLKKAEVIYQWGDLAIDYLLNPDSVLKKNDGFNLINIQDVSIEGTTYKLFLLPFELGSQRLILAGLISDSHYRETNLKIPFDFFTVFAVLFLLLLIHLPILRIYILGPSERIRDLDIRLIIGSYFVAAFFGFFLFSRIFLSQEQSVQNKKLLENLSEKVRTSLYTELDSIQRQLTAFDDSLIGLCKKKQDNLLAGLVRNPSTTVADSLDKILKPGTYPFPDGIFWISDSGRWVARWGFKKALTKSPLIGVSDRLYYRDFKNGEAFSIPGIDDSLGIQPTLSKLDGDYSVSVAKRSKVDPYLFKVNMKRKDDYTGKVTSKDTLFKINPTLIGLSAKMYSVDEVILPPGYGFSIMGENGNVLFDSKKGRPLLSNILKEAEDPGALRQTAVYHTHRYFESFRMRGKTMSLLSTPIKGLPGQLLVYYNHFRSDGFQGHLIGLSAGLVGTIILLLILSSMINQWSKNKARMLESRSQYFEWLHPSSSHLKLKYYRELIRYMLTLFTSYLLAWLVIEVLVPRSEFSLLYISVLFPFYIALYYFELRERYYDVMEHRTELNWYFSRPSLALRGLLLLIIILINCFVSIEKYSAILAWPVLIIQLVWAGLIAYSAYHFRHDLMAASTAPPIQTTDSENEPSDLDREKINKNPSKKIPKPYIWLILIAVALVSIVPAFGIFWLFFRQETALYMNTDQLIMANQIDQRRVNINHNLADFNLKTNGPADTIHIHDRKLSQGIYMLSGNLSETNLPELDSPILFPSMEYIDLHNHLFSGDSLVMNWIGPGSASADGTWSFGKDSSRHASLATLEYSNGKDMITPTGFRLIPDNSTFCNTFCLLVKSFTGTGVAFSIFYLVGLCFGFLLAYFLTLSLTKRIFLVELHQITTHSNRIGSLAEAFYYTKPALRQDIYDIILQTSIDYKIDSANPALNNLPFSDRGYPDLKDLYTFEKKMPLRVLENRMPLLIQTMEPVYAELWKNLSKKEKFLLYDFAQDGFANYKAGRDLQVLIEKGFLFFDDLRLSVMTLSFQEFVLRMKTDSAIESYKIISRKANTWNKIRGPLLFLLMAAGIFIFLTQEAVYQKIIGLVGAITTLLPQLGNLFGRQDEK